MHAAGFHFVCLQAFHCCSHSARVDTVAFSQPSKELHTLFLCSCSAEVALLWDVQGCREASDKGGAGLGHKCMWGAAMCVCKP